MFMRVNDCDFDVIVGPRRLGDQGSSVLEDVSPYMTNLYNIEQLLKIND
jgi:hypothetical protein